MSEFGMQAMPDLESIKQYTLPEDFDTATTVMKVHQKHPTGYKTLKQYLQMENIKANNFQEFVSATQELQRRALVTSIEAQLQSKGRCMGSLLWQFNDCWPVCSWSIVDYYGRKKKAFGAIKALYR